MLSFVGTQRSFLAFVLQELAEERLVVFLAVGTLLLPTCDACLGTAVVWKRDQLTGDGERRHIRAELELSDGKRKYKPYIPTIVMGNVRSPVNKTDEESRDCGIMCRARE